MKRGLFGLLVGLIFALSATCFAYEVKTFPTAQVVSVAADWQKQEVAATKPAAVAVAATAAERLWPRVAAPVTAASFALAFEQSVRHFHPIAARGGAVLSGPCIA